jgi:formylglycine-generating enzyme required for sulfatase activity
LIILNLQIDKKLFYELMYRVITINIFLIIAFCNKNPIKENLFNEFDCKKKNSQIDYSKMSCIPSGEFIMGYNNFTIEEDTGKRIYDTYPEHKVFLNAYWIDKYEVTYQEYQECVKSGICSSAGPNYQGFSQPNQPILGVNWYQALQYCQWKHKRLPTEAEWEKAARGEKGDFYPWGNEPATCEKAIIKEKEQKGCGKETTWDVGSKGAFRYQLYDMAGNSWEWVNDWYSDNYEKCGDNCLKENPKGPCEGKFPCPGYNKKVVRGGSWWWSGEFAAGYNRRAHYPENIPFHHFGFRCAADG